MVKALARFIFMLVYGLKYIKIFKKTFFHPFITLKQGYQQLSLDRQAYSNKVLDFLNIEVKVYGEIPEQNHILYAINHRSHLDIIVMESIFSKHNKNGAWIAKQDLFDAFYGRFFKYSGSISVDIKKRKGLLNFFKTIKYALQKVDDLNIYIFPEGERFTDKEIQKFQNGAQKIAKSNNMDIVPVFINETLETVLRQAPFKKKKIVKVHFNEIISHYNLEENYNSFMKKVQNG